MDDFVAKITRIFRHNISAEDAAYLHTVLRNYSKTRISSVQQRRTVNRIHRKYCEFKKIRPAEFIEDVCEIEKAKFLKDLGYYEAMC